MKPATTVRNLYVHVPYCDDKCFYCAFYSVQGSAADRRAYTTLPGQELEQALRTGGVAVACDTLYVGGGTPALLGPESMQTLAHGLKRQIACEAITEWTVEVTPPTATDALLRALQDMGVTRISMGVQCFDDGVLQRLGRRHDAAAAEAAARRIRAAGFCNYGLDLIAGLPGLSERAWGETVTRALALEPAHLSVYALSLEPGSVLTAQVARNEVILPTEETQMAALAQAESLLAAAGFEHYEISNYARPGFACRHNLACWRGEDYLGLGPSAASRIGLSRRSNTADVTAYAQAMARGDTPPATWETLDPTTDAAERFLFTLRLSEGVDLQTHAAHWPAARPLVAAWQQRLKVLARNGITTQTTSGRWRLTARGREVADAVSRDLWPEGAA